MDILTHWLRRHNQWGCANYDLRSRPTVLRLCAVACELCVCVCLGEGICVLPRCVCCVLFTCSVSRYCIVVLNRMEKVARARTIAISHTLLIRPHTHTVHVTVLYLRLCRLPGSGLFRVFHLCAADPFIHYQLSYGTVWVRYGLICAPRKPFYSIKYTAVP